ncbi:MAG TPA: peptidase U32 family protein [Alphaproteobacteria bacterium]|nr:peptidase U32 family protein [Alphaproteobacteria bacterium]
MTGSPLELVCPAGTPGALRAAVDAGADTVYLGFRDETNARNFPGLNFSRQEFAEGAAYAHSRGSKIYVAINTFPDAGRADLWHRAVDDAAAEGADAVVVADAGLLAYARQHHPNLRLHLSVQASASNTEALGFYQSEYGIKRAVLPRVLTIPEIARITAETTVEVEVFVFGGLCPMAEGRCVLSAYVTGVSPNRQGACAPASHVRYEDDGGKMISKLGRFTINEFEAGEPAGYPTPCKGRYRIDGEAKYLFEEPVSLLTAAVLPDMVAAGVRALKIEGRQRGRAYVADAVAAWRRLVDSESAQPGATAASLEDLTEGRRITVGAYRKTWQ